MTKLSVKIIIREEIWKYRNVVKEKTNTAEVKYRWAFVKKRTLNIEQ